MSAPAAQDDASPEAGKWPTALVSVFQGLAVNAEEWAGSLTALKAANDALGHKYPDHVLEDCAAPVSSHGRAMSPPRECAESVLRSGSVNVAPSPARDRAAVERSPRAQAISVR